MEEEIVSVSLQALFQSLCKSLCDDDATYTRYGHCIRREPCTVDSSCYYDLYRSSDSAYRLCCDGEQCKVLERTADYVKLIDVENIDNEELEGIDTTFRLSIKEFGIATFGRMYNPEED